MTTLPLTDVRDILMQNQNLMTVTELSQYLKLAPQTIYNMVSENRIPAYRINSRCLRFRLEEIEEWLSKVKQKGRVGRVPEIMDSS